eukprot:SAG31_NODE_12391_length_945_cov_1.451537_1_plen_24_part_10
MRNSADDPSIIWGRPAGGAVRVWV